MKDPRSLHKVPKSAVLPGSFASGVGGLSRRLVNRATLYIQAAALVLLAGPASSDLRFSPGALGDAQLPETRFRRKSPPLERISGAPDRPPEKHHEHRFAQHPLSKIQRAGVRLLGGYLRQNEGAHHEHQQGLGSRKASHKTPQKVHERTSWEKSKLQNVV